MIRTIKLTDGDAMDLLVALGAATARNMDFVKISDRILVQLGGENYTYGRPRAEVLKELKEDGIEVPE